MGLSRTVSEIDVDFIRKSQNSPLVFCAPAEGVTFGIGYRRWGQKTRMTGLPGRERSLTIISAVWIHIHQRDRQTDRQTNRWTDKWTLVDSKGRAYALRHVVKMEQTIALYVHYQGLQLELCGNPALLLTRY